MTINKLFELLINGTPLSRIQMQEVIKNCMTEMLSDVQIATFLALMRMKGETVDDLTAAAAFYCADVCQNFTEAVTKAAAAIDSGLAEQRFLQLRDLTRTYQGSNHE